MAKPKFVSMVPAEPTEDELGYKYANLWVLREDGAIFLACQITKYGESKVEMRYKQWWKAPKEEN